jgi:hypothetical protein
LYASAASSLRERKPSFAKSDATWFATVRGDVPRCTAISAFDLPAMIANATSLSASVRLWGRSAGDSG